MMGYTKFMVLSMDSVRQKIANIENGVHQALSGIFESVPLQPARDLEILPPHKLPAKRGLSYKEGQARLLHDLASIELQAMELAYRTLLEFPNVDQLFREQLAELTLSESRHLTLCLDGIEKLGFKWGQWPAHLGLWECVSESDSLLDRLLIVHRYLEGSGLDAGETILNKLNGIEDSFVKQTVKIIVEEEVEHVSFGSRWYKEFCLQDGLDPETDFQERIQKLKRILPRRLERIVSPIRKRAGFSDMEIKILEKLREEQLSRVGG
jgi:uncharacterized ferritin-like protein (DUF455 family)